MKHFAMFGQAALIAVVVSVLANPLATACSRVLWNNNGKFVVTARTMDWSHSFEDIKRYKDFGGDEDQPVKVLNPRNPSLAGEVSRAFEPVK